MAYGLIHTLGNAPGTWHTVQGLPGLFHPHKPVPLPVTRELAQRWSDDPGCPVELVRTTQTRIDDAQRELQALRGALMKAVRVERDVAPREQVEAAIDAVSANQRIEE